MSESGRTHGDDSWGMMRSWTPPAEPLKPSLPYVPGAKLRIHRHIPPKPFGRGYPLRDNERLPVLRRMLRQTTLVDLCLSNPPLEGTIQREQSRELEVIEQLAAEDGRGPQVFVCRLDDGQETYVAKAYDPMYYGFRDPVIPHFPWDVTHERMATIAEKRRLMDRLRQRRVSAVQKSPITTGLGPLTFRSLCGWAQWHAQSA